MMSGMYAAISGLDAHQTMLDVTANNLANVDTIGYKAQSAQFSDELSQLIQPGTAANGFSAGTNPLQVGLGTQIGSIDNVMTAGGVESTGNPPTSRSRATAGCASPTATSVPLRRRSTPRNTRVPVI